MQSKIKILVTGKNGQLGQSLQKLIIQNSACNIQHSFTFVGREELDLSNPQSITDFFKNKTYDAIINCAAYTAVDKAESEPGLANQINHLAVKQLAQIAKEQDAVFIHVSTDYVFDGQNYKPYIEDDTVNPKSVYGSTKLLGEQVIQGINPKGCIIRTSWIYSEYGNNFVKTMLRLGKERDQLNVIFDQVGTPTYAGDLAKAILQIVTTVIASEAKQSIAEHKLLTANCSPLTDKNEIFHFSNEGVCSWYDFAQTIFKYAKIPCNILSIETKDYPTPAKRPHYSLLNKAKIKKDFGLEIPYWKSSLKECISKLN